MNDNPAISAIVYPFALLLTWQGEWLRIFSTACSVRRCFFKFTTANSPVSKVFSFGSKDRI